MCSVLNRGALSSLPSEFHIRNCRRDELSIWKHMPFDELETAEEYEPFMTEFFKSVYEDQEELFFEKTLFVCNEHDKPIATCLLWKAYGEFNTIHWLKVLKGYEGKGIGRALLSIIMKDLKEEDYPIYLHTQPESYRAIKLYADFGFQLLSDDPIGTRSNDLEECLPFLNEYMPEKAFSSLTITQAPKHFLAKMSTFDTIEF